MTQAPYDQEELELLLMDYAFGALNDVHRLFVSSYLSFCPDARAFVSDCEKLGGTIIEQHCPPAKMSRQSLEAVLQKLSEPQPEENRTKQGRKASCDIPGIVGNMMPPALIKSLNSCMKAPQKWRPLFPGVKVLDIPVHSSCGSKAALIKAAPGARMPAHEHRARELTLVLDGCFSDQYGRHNKGDIMICDAGTTHAPVADQQQGCLVLNTIDAPVRHTGVYAFLNITIRH